MRNNIFSSIDLDSRTIEISTDAFLKLLKEDGYLDNLGWYLMDYYSYEDPRDDVENWTTEDYDKLMETLTWGDMLDTTVGGTGEFTFESFSEYLWGGPEYKERLLEDLYYVLGEEGKTARDIDALLNGEDLSFVFGPLEEFAGKKILSESEAKQYFLEVGEVISAAEEKAGRVFSDVSANLSGSLMGVYANISDCPYYNTPIEKLMEGVTTELTPLAYRAERIFEWEEGVGVWDSMEDRMIDIADLYRGDTDRLTYMLENEDMLLEEAVEYISRSYWDRYYDLKPESYKGRIAKSFSVAA